MQRDRPMDDRQDPIQRDREWHWAIRIPVGILLGLCAIACAAFSSVLVFDPPPKSPAMARFVGMAMILVCAWIGTLGWRLVANRPDYGGLLSPFVLRVVAVYAAAMPAFLIVTGNAASWSLPQYLQASAYFLGAIGLWRIAAWRKASHLKA